MTIKGKEGLWDELLRQCFQNELVLQPSCPCFLTTLWEHHQKAGLASPSLPGTADKVSVGLPVHFGVYKVVHFISFYFLFLHQG